MPELLSFTVLSPDPRRCYRAVHQDEMRSLYEVSPLPILSLIEAPDLLNVRLTKVHVQAIITQGLFNQLIISIEGNVTELQEVLIVALLCLVYRVLSKIKTKTRTMIVL